jgi:hypothetical protein
MIIREIKLKNRTVWLVIDQLRTYSTDFYKIEDKPEFLCYFKLTEPNSTIYGELLRDKDNKPLIFNSINDATEKAIDLLNKKL